MAKYQKFEDLQVWQDSRELANKIYDYSESGAFSKDFALRDQIRRAAISIMSNIAEGFESSSDQNFVRYLGYAKSSAAEVRSQLYLAHDRLYISDNEFQTILEITNSCGKQLSGFMSYLRSKSRSRRISENTSEYKINTEF